MRSTKAYRKRMGPLLDGQTWVKSNPEYTYCYCGALDLTYPHYVAEHTAEHDNARELRARLASGAE